MRDIRRLLSTTRRARFPYAVVVIGGGVYYTIKSLSAKVHGTVPGGADILDPSKEPLIFWMDPEDRAPFLKQHMARWSPITWLTRPIADRLFERAKRSVDSPDEEELQTFAKFSNFLDTECSHYSVFMDLKTAVALARNGADPRLFLTPGVIAKKDSTMKDYYGTKFRALFDSLPKEDIHMQLRTLIPAALKHYHPTEKDEEDHTLDAYTGFHSELFPPPPAKKGIGEKEFLRTCLWGLVSYARLPERQRDLLSLSTLELLVVIWKDYHDSVELMSLVLRVLANLSCLPESGEPIRDSGCLQLIAEYSQSPHVKLALPAKRALHNLDRRDFGGQPNPILPSSIYQLHPEHGCQSNCGYNFDVVFIHGLMGGIFRTWRRHDYDPSKVTPIPPRRKWRARRFRHLKQWMADLRSKSLFQKNQESREGVQGEEEETEVYPMRILSEDGTLSEEIGEVPLEVFDRRSEPTDCWPRDWLPKDCPNCRIIGVDFESFVSRWMTVCPLETEERRLADRSSELLKKLLEIGIGERPVVFVTHSMGGLLLKSMLCQAASIEDKRMQKLCKNTTGIVFCSVPHKGSDVAVLNTVRRWLLLPTEEIEELCNENGQLNHLNECFLKLYEKYKFSILSFGEALETVTGLGMKFRLVPYASADLGVGEFYPLNVDHLGTCKPWSRGSFLYVKLVEFIRETCNLYPQEDFEEYEEEEEEGVANESVLAGILSAVSDVKDSLTALFYSSVPEDINEISKNSSSNKPNRAPSEQSNKNRNKT